MANKTTQKKTSKIKLPRLIGVIHLPALPGSPAASGWLASDALARAGALAVHEARLLEKAGFEGIILENFGDAPFYKNQVPAETIAAMSIIATAVRETTLLKLGINVLRNDTRSALAIAAVSGADFIRVNVLSGVVATDQGLIESDAAFLIRERIRLNAESIAILADVQVKHAQSLSNPNLSLSIEETAGRGGASGVILTGATTGRAPNLDLIKEAYQTAAHMNVPLYMGSGMDLTTVIGLPSPQIGVIVGSSLRVGGQAGQPMDSKRLRAFVKAFNKRRRT